MDGFIDLQEIIMRLIKYLVMGLMIVIASYAIPKQSLNIREILWLSLTTSSTFAVLDIYIPVVGAAAKTGAGLGIGANLVGFPGGF